MNKQLKKHFKWPLKNKLVISIIFVLILIGLFLIFANKNDSNQISKPPVHISSISGNVEILSKSNLTKALNNKELFLNDEITTKDNSNARLNIFSKAYVDMDSNTKIRIDSLDKNNIVLFQENGLIRAKFNGNPKTDLFKIYTPNTYLAVKGTQFLTQIESNLTTVLVESGIVNLSNFNQTIILNKYEKGASSNNEIKKIQLTDGDKQYFLSKEEKTLNSLNKQRWNLIQSHSFILNFAKKKYGVTDDDIKYYLDQIDSGELNDRELAKKSPFEIDDIDKLLRLNDNIKNKQNEIKEMLIQFNMTT